MKTVSEYTRITAAELDKMVAAAIRLGAWPYKHERSDTWQVQGHRIDLWFERRFWPDPKPLVLLQRDGTTPIYRALEKAEQYTCPHDISLAF